MDEEDQWSVWMGLAQNGEEAAYANLLQAILPRIRSIVGRRVNDPGRAEDIVQEVFLSVHKNRHTYDPKLKFAPWLHVISERRTIDFLRKLYRNNEREVLVGEYPETFMAGAANTIEDEALAFDDRDRLNAALALLPPGQRQAVELLKLKELSLKEAAEVSGMTVASLKVSMHRGLKSLRAQMAEEGKP
ncbi:MAG: sigma-70 family RNA polymerase sigma factor [Magnetovibrio sp.]|nr:sigma-70 family RNA polymerase sigma factor [Magnetovibrio sp.]